MEDKQEMIPTGVYFHSSTGNLYFVDDVVDWTGKGFPVEIGVSYHRLYEQGRRCVRPLSEFLELQDTGRNNPVWGNAEIRSRFLLVCQQPSQSLKFLTPENTVYIPERHIVKKVVMVDGVVYVCLIPYHEREEVRMVLAQYFTKISHLHLVSK